MEGPTGRREEGRREESKRERRAALTAAAHRLFDERGYEATTVRDIAAAAGLTERTFYRYFDGKEGLLAEDYRAWLATLGQAIAARPASEPPLTAVYQAVLAIGRPANAGESAYTPVWLFQDRPFAGLRRIEARPLVRLETTLTDAIAARLRAAAPAALSRGGAGGDTSGPEPALEFQAQVLARVAVAGLRSALIHHRQLRRAGELGVPTVKQLLGQAFAIITDPRVH